MSKDERTPSRRNFFTIQFHPSMMNPMGDAKSLWRKLTAREQQIARLAAQRLSDAEIAARLVLSEKTVRNHLSRVYSKLGINSRHEIKYVLKDVEDGK